MQKKGIFYLEVVNMIRLKNKKMKLNFFNKKKTGWEIKDLMDSLKMARNGLNNELLDFSKSYPLSSINPNRDRFIVIRKFSAREFDDKIDMLNASNVEASEHHPISQYGMTLVSNSDKGSSSHNVILPNSLMYKKVELMNDIITIYHSRGITTTNFNEINCLWTLKNLSVQEIENRFNDLTNYIEKPQKIVKISENILEDKFFGKLIFNKDLDSFQTEINFNDKRISLSFINTSSDQMKLNLRKTSQLIPKLKGIGDSMIIETLLLKNENWLEEGEEEFSVDRFKKEINIYGINIFEDGSADIYYKANDLFWGHEIQVSIDNNYKYESSTIVG